MSHKESSGGILLYKSQVADPEVLLVLPGGPPSWHVRGQPKKWSIPKGKMQPEEGIREAAYREFQEETGMVVPGRPALPLGFVAQSTVKEVWVWAVAGDFDATQFRSPLVAVEWPRETGHMQTFPEIERVAWFPLANARANIIQGQLPFLDRFVELLNVSSLTETNRQ